MQIKTIMRYYLSEWLSSKSQQIIKAGEDVVKREPSCAVCEKGIWYILCGKEYGDSSTKLKVEILYDPIIPLLSIYLKKTKTLIKKMYAPLMFIEALFTIVNIWKQPDRYIKKI